MNKVYVVYREGGGIPGVIHNTRDMAMVEASRLADKHPGETFHVLATTAQAKTDIPKIRVGDTVNMSACNLAEKDLLYEVVGIDEDSIETRPLRKLAAPLHMIKFISRGPEVHTFEDVQWTQFVDASIPYVSRINNRPFAVLKGKRGTLIFKEDTP